jgi:hypothetical protein
VTEVHSTVWELDGRILDVLADLGASFERVEAGAYVVLLQGTRRPTTVVWLIAGEQAVSVEAFVMHVVVDACPDPAALHRSLLARNLRLRDVHFAVDEVGDVFLTGSLPHAAVDVAAVDRLLGEVLQLLEDSQDALVQTAYGDRLAADAALAHKVLSDGAGRRPAGTPEWAPRRDVRR